MARIPTPIPESVATKARSYASEPLLDMLWKLFLVIVGGSILYGAMASGGVLVSAIAGIGIFVFISDDIEQAAKDIWNRNFWVWKT